MKFTMKVPMKNNESSNEKHICLRNGVRLSNFSRFFWALHEGFCKDIYSTLPKIIFHHVLCKHSFRKQYSSIGPTLPLT